jgi:hypothetical protein
MANRGPKKTPSSGGDDGPTMEPAAAIAALDCMAEKRFSTAWPQFLIARSTMLDSFDRARVHARSQPVQTHHGVVGEAAVRSWLGEFLPKRYGVASGYIRSQGQPKPFQSSHFDVLIYDQLEAPTLWIEDKPGSPDSERMKIIPAEFVRAVIEVKAAYSRRTVKEASEKIAQLQPLTVGVDVIGEDYPKYLPASAAIVMLFFESSPEDSQDLQTLELFHSVQLNRAFYGVILRGNDRENANDSGIIRGYKSEQPAEAISFQTLTMTRSTQVSSGQHAGIMLDWTDVNFSIFAFTLLSHLRGGPRQGWITSFHGLQLGGAE